MVDRGKRMNRGEALQQLHDELVAIYPWDDADLKRLVIRIDPEKKGTIDFTGKPTNIWDEIIDEAVEQGFLEKLVAVVEEEYPRRHGPRRALEAYLRAVEANPRVEDYDRFLNRDDEFDACASLLAHPRRRILLLHGKEERGRTRLLDVLRERCGDRHRVSAQVDFRAQTLTEPKMVIGYLREQLGFSFSWQMDQEELRLRREHAALARAAQERRVASTAAVPSGLASGSSGSLYPAEPRTVPMGDALGRHQRMIGDSDFVVEPGAGSALSTKEEERLRAAAFKAALRNLQAEQRLILAFDHWDVATDSVQAWLRDLVLGFLLREAADWANLWFIVAGRRVFLQDQVAARPHRLQSLEIGSLPEKAVVEFWVGEVGLPRDTVRDYFTDSGGNTRWMCTFLENRARRRLGRAGL